MLALSTLIRSTSVIGLGEAGRLKALELGDLVQSHFDMSLNSGWITPDLAQAALVRFHRELNNRGGADSYLIVYLV